MIRLLKFLIPCCWAALCAIGPAHAQLTVEITGAGANRIPLAIGEFEGEKSPSQSVSNVIRQDLERSGLFRLVESVGPVSASATPDWASWKTRGADALVSGAIRPLPDGRFEVRFRLSDIQKQGELTSASFIMPASEYRATGHRIADAVYEKLIGEPGVFSTQVAYVAKLGPRYELQIADADGGNPQTALASKEPIISPTWSPDGSRVAYVSFEAKKPVVYVHNLNTGRRDVVANFKGSNSAPAWSPDGSRLAVVLTKDGGSQLFTLAADGSGVRRLASSSAIDTEPRYSSDGKFIYFTSDRGGGPQIYRIPASGGEAQRISFEGAYNVTPRPSPDGKSLAYIARNGGKFQLAIMDLATRQVQILSDSTKDESPSFAPNGRMIVYATEVAGKGVLAAVSVDGRVKQKLSARIADIREPTWGPFPK